MAELFDLVKAAPPPDKVRASPQRTVSPLLSPMSSLPPRASSPCSLPPHASTPLLDDSPNGTETALVSPRKRAIVRIKRLSLQEGANICDTLVSNLDLSSQNARICLTKTKAQQKQFDDELPRKRSNSANARLKSLHNDAKIRPCCVRVKRLIQAEIDKHTQSTKQKRRRLNQSNNLVDSFSLPTSSKFVKQRKWHSSESIPRSSAVIGRPASSKKITKSSPQIHFKLTQQKSPKFCTKHLRKSTPPPSTSLSSPRGKKALMERYGAKVFRSYVRLKRCKHPVAVAFETNKRGRKSRRLNLSVSFRDAVEIIGISTDQSVGGSIPTRLTKVENGKVVQQVALDETQFTTPSTITPKLLSAQKKNRKKREANDKTSSSRRSSKASRLSADRLPVSDMSRLRIDDDDVDVVGAEDNDEYIVPNDPPDCISSTKHITTNISTNEDSSTEEVAKNDGKASSAVLKSPSPPSIGAPSPPPAPDLSSPTAPSSPLGLALAVRPSSPPGPSAAARSTSLPSSSSAILRASPLRSSSAVPPLPLSPFSASRRSSPPGPSSEARSSPPLSPYMLESCEQEIPDELSDDKALNSEELTKVAIKGPTPHRALKSTTPAGELKDQEEDISRHNDESPTSTNEAESTNKPLPTERQSSKDRSTSLLDKALKLSSPSVESENSFCSARDDVEQTNGERKEATKLKSVSPDADESELQIKEEIEESFEEIDRAIEGETQTESLDRTKYLEKEEDSKTKITMPDETFKLVAEYSSDDGSSKAAIKEPIASAVSAEERKKTDEAEPEDENKDKAFQKSSFAVDVGTTSNEEVAKPRLSLALLSSHQTLKSSQSTNINDDEDSQERNIEQEIDDDNEDLCLNIRRQVFSEDEVDDNL